MEFETLFSDDKNIKDLRNDLLPDFFMDLNDFYWGNFLITIARLLDNHKQGQNLNLTLFTLVEILKEQEKEESKELESKLINLKKEYKDIINYRRKHLAHYDLNYTTGGKDFGTSTHIDEVHKFLESMLEIINLTLTAIGETQKSGLVMYPGRYRGARELLRILDNERQTRLKDYD
ncbi:AbiU2 domain-containing protein [Sunxiuqinia sp. sy24]|uniref:AbiU2 domain-containing protein n=1 Tax=Sunxiuqinia sp. sy24 TaxID=3461495 RepID=UPI0040454F9B